MISESFSRDNILWVLNRLKIEDSIYEVNDEEGRGGRIGDEGQVRNFLCK